MKLTLKQLNDGYQALKRLAEQDYPKASFKLAYKVGKIYKAARSEVDLLSETLEKMMPEFGFSKYDSVKEASADLDRGRKIERYNAASLDLLRGTEIEIWGDPFRPEEILGVIPITAADYGDLDGWLIVGNLTDEQIEKAAAAGA